MILDYRRLLSGGRLPSGGSLSADTMRSSRLGREIAWVLVLKVAALVLLYYCFFSPSHRPVADTTAHLIAPLASMPEQQTGGR